MPAPTQPSVAHSAAACLRPPCLEEGALPQLFQRLLKPHQPESQNTCFARCLCPNTSMSTYLSIYPSSVSCACSPSIDRSICLYMHTHTYIHACRQTDRDRHRQTETNRQRQTQTERQACVQIFRPERQVSTYCGRGLKETGTASFETYYIIALPTPVINPKTQ